MLGLCAIQGASPSPVATRSARMESISRPGLRGHLQSDVLRLAWREQFAANLPDDLLMRRNGWYDVAKSMRETTAYAG